MVQHPSYSDQELLQKMATGDSGAFRELYGLYWKRMYAAAFKRIPDHEVVS